LACLSLQQTVDSSGGQADRLASRSTLLQQRRSPASSSRLSPSAVSTRFGINHPPRGTGRRVARAGQGSSPLEEGPPDPGPADPNNPCWRVRKERPLRARLELLCERLQDQRSGKVPVLSHCLLNQNVRYLGGAVHPGMVEEVVEEARRRGYGLYQLPCPEQRAWVGYSNAPSSPPTPRRGPWAIGCAGRCSGSSPATPTSATGSWPGESLATSPTTCGRGCGGGRGRGGWIAVLRGPPDAGTLGCRGGHGGLPPGRHGSGGIQPRRHRGQPGGWGGIVRPRASEGPAPPGGSGALRGTRPGPGPGRPHGRGSDFADRVRYPSLGGRLGSRVEPAPRSARSRLHWGAAIGL
jgi:hypothetical protein